MVRCAGLIVGRILRRVFRVSVLVVMGLYSLFRALRLLACPVSSFAEDVLGWAGRLGRSTAARRHRDLDEPHGQDLHHLAG